MPKSKKILLLGGTTEAYELAELLYEKNVLFISSLAGRTQNPRIPIGKVRKGGFGGIDGLKKYIIQQQIEIIVDATHPFAEIITKNAHQAAFETNINYLRLERPLWQQKAEDQWNIVQTIEQAVAMIPKNSRCFLAIGRQHLQAFSKRTDVDFIARMRDLPEKLDDFHHLKIILDRPQDKNHELVFLKEHKFDCIVCRNSGGDASYAKIEAARILQLTVIMQTRRELANMQIVSNINDALNVIKHLQIQAE